MIRVDSVWSGASVVGGGFTQLFFQNPIADAQACTDAVEDFWTAILSNVATSAQVQVGNTVTEIDAATGSLISVAGVTPPPIQIGTGSGAVLPLATQGLIRLGTSNVFNGRLVRGRVFLPAMLEVANSTAGKVEVATKADVNAAALALVNDLTAAWTVWHRPGPAGPGASCLVTSAVMWDDWAVLRSRRD